MSARYGPGTRDLGDCDGTVESGVLTCGCTRSGQKCVLEDGGTCVTPGPTWHVGDRITTCGEGVGRGV